jgi:hypothetical protein
MSSGINKKNRSVPGNQIRGLPVREFKLNSILNRKIRFIFKMNLTKLYFDFDVFVFKFNFNKLFLEWNLLKFCLALFLPFPKLSILCLEKKRVKKFLGFFLSLLRNKNGTKHFFIE